MYVLFKGCSRNFLFAEAGGMIDKLVFTNRKLFGLKKYRGTIQDKPIRMEGFTCENERIE